MLRFRIVVLSIVPANLIWFSTKPVIWGCLNSYYKQSSFSGKVFGYKRNQFYTKVISLNQPKEAFKAGFEKNTLYEIKRAIKDGVETGIEINLYHFVDFYNSFAKTKELPCLSTNFIKYRSNLMITKATFNEQSIVMHAYLTDIKLKRVRLLYSASLYRNEDDTQLRATIGRANRLLHYQDMCLFKEQGFDIYDLGGYAPETTDKSLLAINRFKNSFGGELKLENDYLPLPAFALSIWKELLKKRVSAVLQ